MLPGMLTDNSLLKGFQRTVEATRLHDVLRYEEYRPIVPRTDVPRYVHRVV